MRVAPKTGPRDGVYDGAVWWVPIFEPRNGKNKMHPDEYGGHRSRRVVLFSRAAMTGILMRFPMVVGGSGPVLLAFKRFLRNLELVGCCALSSFPDQRTASPEFGSWHHCTS